MQTGSSMLTVIGLAAASLAALVGCGGLTPADAGRIQPSDLPSAVGFVAENESTFAQDPDDALRAVDPGTVIDPLSGLDGCWGSYYRLVADSSAAAVPAGTPLLDTYEAYRFDSVTGAMTYQIYQQSVYGTLGIYGAYEGRFTMLDEGRISVVWDQIRVRDPVSDEVETHDVSGNEEPVEWALSITLSGDQLRIHNEADDGTPADETAADYERRVFTRFACP